MKKILIILIFFLSVTITKVVAGEIISNPGVAVDTILLVADFDITNPVNDALWNNAQAMEVKNLAIGANSFATGTFQAMWTKDYLYLNINVTDADPIKINYPGDKNFWNNDGVEIFIDPTGEHTVGPRTNYQHQLRFNYGLDTITGAPVDWLAPNEYGNSTISLGAMLFKQSVIPKGYNFKIRLPWYTLWLASNADTAPATCNSYVDSANQTIVAGKSVSFEMSILNNSSTTGMGVRTSLVNWANDSGRDTAYYTSEFWGTLVLKEYDIKSNHPPVISNPLPDKAILVSNSTVFLIPSNTATDQDRGDTLTYSLILAGSTGLPNWLVYKSNYSSLVCTPNINQTGTYNVVIIATDLAGNQVTDTFKLIVGSNTTLINTSVINDLTIYPNPIQESFRIRGIESKAILTLTDINGRLLLVQDISDNEEVNICSLPQGIYIVKIKTESGILEKKLLKN